MTSLQSYAVFIDYDNLTDAQQNNGILDVATRALMQIPIDRDVTRIKCSVRVYGGWYEDTQMTRKAQDVSSILQQDFPSVIRLSSTSGNSVWVTINGELALATLEEPGHHLFDTFRRKGKPRNIRVKTESDVSCSDSECVRPLIKKLLRTGHCPKQGCSTTNIVFRIEQKLVDTMLTCDLIHASSEGHTKIILVSGDDDFLPPIRSVLLRGTSVARFHPKPCQKRSIPPDSGAVLIELEL